MSSLDATALAAFRAGRHSTLYRHLGAHPDADGCTFALWAPGAREVRVVGDFAPRGRKLARRSGDVWTGRVRGAVVRFRRQEWVSQIFPLPPTVASQDIETAVAMGEPSVSAP